MTDLVTFGEALLRLSPSGTDRLETAREFSVRVGGTEAATAVAAQRLGADPVWLSKLPASPLADRVLGELHGHGIEPAVVRSETGRQGLSFHEHGGRPRGTRLVHDREDTAFRTTTVEELPTDRLESADLFYTTGVTPALSNRLAETTANLFSAATRTGLRSAFELNYRPELWDPDRARAMVTRLVPAVDILVATTDDARTVFDLEGDPRRIAHQLTSTWDVETVVITRGDGGAIALHDGVVHEQAPMEAETVDPSGAGDAFTGAFLARRLAGDDIGTALAWAAATAALVRTVPGEMPIVTADEVRALLADGGDASASP